MNRDKICYYKVFDIFGEIKANTILVTIHIMYPILLRLSSKYRTSTHVPRAHTHTHTHKVPNFPFE